MAIGPALAPPKRERKKLRIFPRNAKSTTEIAATEMAIHINDDHKVAGFCLRRLWGFFGSFPESGTTSVSGRFALDESDLTIVCDSDKEDVEPERLFVERESRTCDARIAE